MRKFLAALLLLPLLALAQVQPFSPVYQGSTTISCTSSSAATALNTKIAQQAQLQLYNSGSVNIYVEVGASTIAAAVASGYVVPPGAILVITVSPTITHLACIVAATTTTLYVSVGTGN